MTSAVATYELFNAFNVSLGTAIDHCACSLQVDLSMSGCLRSTSVSHLRRDWPLWSLDNVTAALFMRHLDSLFHSLDSRVQRAYEAVEYVGAHRHVRGNGSRAGDVRLRGKDGL